MSKDYLAIWKDQETYPDFTPHLEELVQSLSQKDARIAELEKERDGIRSTYEKLSEAFDDLNVQNNFHAAKMGECNNRIKELESRFDEAVKEFEVSGKYWRFSELKQKLFGKSTQEVLK